MQEGDRIAVYNEGSEGALGSEKYLHLSLLCVISWFSRFKLQSKYYVMYFCSMLTLHVCLKHVFSLLFASNF